MLWSARYSDRLVWIKTVVFDQVLGLDEKKVLGVDERGEQGFGQGGVFSQEPALAGIGVGVDVAGEFCRRPETG